VNRAHQSSQHALYFLKLLFKSAVRVGIEELQIPSWQQMMFHLRRRPSSDLKEPDQFAI